MISRALPLSPVTGLVGAGGRQAAAREVMALLAGFRRGRDDISTGLTLRAGF